MEHLEELAEKRAKQWEMKEEHTLKVIIQAEASKRTFARHRKWMKPRKKGAILHLLLPKPGISQSEDDCKKNTDKIK